MDDICDMASKMKVREPRIRVPTPKCIKFKGKFWQHLCFNLPLLSCYPCNDRDLQAHNNSKFELCIADKEPHNDPIFRRTHNLPLDDCVTQKMLYRWILGHT